MRKLLGALLIIIALPVLGALSAHSRREAQAFNSVAVAGHTMPGGAYCACGCPSCECEPGEPIMSCGGNRATPSPVNGKPDNSIDFGSASLMLALILMVYFKTRS